MSGNFVAGEVIRPGKHDVSIMGISAGLNVVKGQFYTTATGGNLVFLGTGSNENGLFIALESVDNTNGAAGEKTVQVAGVGSYVTAEMGGAVVPGEYVGNTGTNPAKLVGETVADITSGTIIGRYIGLPGGLKVPSADGDIGVILLGAA